MEVNVKQAIKIFFSKSSFEMIFMEAFANALDANATEFKISIELDDYANLQNLKIKIEDNGEGFTDKRYSKFSKLLDVEEKSHKG
ncbi:MAG: ATP-binding protein, partial [Muribaculum sp.]|nr:ATP-binding protein [Muribaculum sp.]